MRNSTSVFCRWRAGLGLGLLAWCAAWANAVTPAPTPTPASVRGRVTYADTGHPVRLAQVRVIRLDDPAEAGNQAAAEQAKELLESGVISRREFDYYERALRTSVTDLSGAFSWDGLDPGRYAAVVMGANLVDFGARFSEAENPLLNGPKRAALFDGWFPVFTVTAGATTEIAITARRGGVISGRVLFADGAPVVEAPLTLFRRTAEGKLEPVKFTSQELQADTRGYYRISGLPAGEYIVRAADRELQVSPGHDENTARSAGRLFYSYYATGRKAAKARPVAVQEGVESPDINITLKDVPVRTLSGNVTVKGQPLAGAGVSVAYRDADTGETLKPLATTTGPAGEWRINGLPDGNYQLSVDVSKAKITGAEDKPANALDAKQEVTLAGADLTDYKIALKTGGSVSGEVVLAPGARLDSSFKLLLLREKQTSDEAGAGQQSEYVNQPIPFLFTSLKPGLYHFDWYTSGGNGFYLQKVLHQGRDISDQPLKLAESEELTGLQFVIANDFATLAGRAFADAAYKQPMSGGTVYFVPLKPRIIADLEWYSADINDDGEFEWELPPGEYYVLAATGPESGDVVKTAQKYAAQLPRITLKPNADITKWRVAAFKPPGAR